ncbi:2542_t:CDS:2, partial [Gigaspora rosea]
LPEDLENQLLNFQQFVICLCQQNKYPLGMITNMDETPVYFDMAGSLTHRWISNGGNGLTEKGNLKRADLNTVCRWVLNAWEDISKDIIIRSFKKCGISNYLSGSEDHLIYESDEDSEEKDSDKNDEDSDENDKDSDEYEDENSDETRDEDSDENEYEDPDENKDEYSGKEDEEFDKDNNESDDGNKSNNKMSEYSKWPE